MFNVEKFAKMISTAVEKMESGEEAIPTKVISATGTTRVAPDNCSPDRAFTGYGYCDPYFGWLVPALEEAALILRADLTEDTAEKLWSDGWTRAFLVALYERNDEQWFINDDIEPELYDRLEFNVRTRRGFIEWLMSGELYGYNLPGHQTIMKKKEALLLRNRRRKKVGGD